MQHSGLCDCGCGEHSVWTICHMAHGQKFWFLAVDHMKQWQSRPHLVVVNPVVTGDRPPPSKTHLRLVA